jgi:hypothetical protein
LRSENAHVARFGSAQAYQRRQSHDGRRGKGEFRAAAARPLFSAAGFPMANKRRNCYPSPMAVKSCRVTIEDMSGVEHTVQVSATSLYEAVALGLASLRGEDWVAGIAEGLNTVRVSAVDVPVEHSVRIMDFQSWLAKEGGSPRDRSQRYRVREILGIRDQRAS